MADILVVEDDIDIREILVEVLAVEGHQVYSACNGNEALKRLRADKIDLVITDIIMPEKDGIEMLLEMRKSHPNAKSIAFSGGGRIDGLAYLAMAKRLGAKCVLPKPFTIDSFILAVRNTLEVERLTESEVRLRDACSAEIQGAIADHPIPST